MPIRSTRALAAITAIVAAALLAPVALAVAQAPEQRQLQEARDRISAVSRELDAAEREAGDAEVELAEADERLAEVEAVVNDVAAALERQRTAVAEAAARLAEVEDEAVTVRARLEAQAASMFKHGAVRDFDVLLSSEGAEEALARTTYLRALTLGDASSAEALAAAEVAVEAERQRLQAEEERLDEMLAEQEELLAEVERLRNSRALAAADARARVDQLSQEHDDLEAESERIEALIRRQQEEARAAAREAERRRQQQAAAAPSGGSAQVSAPSSSGFAWPLCAPVTSEYGPRWGRMHQGIDQGARTGTPIGASKAGTVIFAGWQGGYGNLVLIDHHDGVVTAYAHQSSMAVSRGQSVSQGSTIGYVGNTGNSTGPHLHFETRVNGSAVNPRQYLSGSPC
ncbi:murein hydrolase activator EnvC family protein [Nitriliruptor alkaliphilus]|uniref:murein hydrolase activator EnvC family protein n=1 Tax=Nitriliruptor alkaliphilus TaxID=427918 RepID=UPI000696664B|nr:M23 family metallopeptidase [Nitriliruptor alkaliphilus]